MSLVAVPMKIRMDMRVRTLFDDGLWWIMREGQPECLPIATVDRGDDHHEPTRQNAEKWARLFSAAPDLLEALKEVVAISDRKHNAWDKAHAAIRKAEGITA